MQQNRGLSDGVPGAVVLLLNKTVTPNFFFQYEKFRYGSASKSLTVLYML
jgi:hypothetical protein